MRILGIDPGIRNTGWGVVEQSNNRLRHIANGVIRPKSILLMPHVCISSLLVWLRRLRLTDLMLQPLKRFLLPNRRLRR